MSLIEAGWLPHDILSFTASECFQQTSQHYLSARQFNRVRAATAIPARLAAHTPHQHAHHAQMRLHRGGKQ